MKPLRLFFFYVLKRSSGPLGLGGVTGCQKALTCARQTASTMADQEFTGDITKVFLQLNFDRSRQSAGVDICGGRSVQ